MTWPIFAMIWVSGFAGILAIIALIQMVKKFEDGEIAPPRAWKWMVLLSAVWPIFAALFILVGLLTMVVPSLNPRRMPRTKHNPLQTFMAEKKFAFTVEVQGESWDCYHFHSSDGKLGTLGFTKRGEKFVIGLMCAGHLTQVQATHRLEEAHKKDAN